MPSLQTFLILLFSVNSVVGDPQYFIAEPQDVTANIGDEVILQCKVGNREGVLQWTKDGFGLGTTSDLPGFPRYTLTDDLALRINPVSEKDVGTFQCQVGAGENSRPIRSRAAKISVQLPPGVPRILGGDNGVISVNEGGTGILECESYGGKPAADIEWTSGSGKALQLDSVNTRTIKDDETQTFKTVSSLRFQVGRAMHNKTIICSATNIATTEARTTSVRLNVMYLPKVVSLGINTGAGTVTEGDNVVLHCQADANPAPFSYTWKKNGAVLPGKTSQYLKLDNIDNSFNNAVVECEARNSLGSDTARKTLSLQYGPRMIIHPRSVSGKEGDKVSLRCKSDSNPPARYIWLKDSNPQPIEFSDQIDIIVSTYTVGKYECQAIVEGFEHVVSRTAQVSVLEKPKIGAVETQFGVEGEDVELVCPIVSALDSLNVTWYFRGRVLLEGGKYLMGRNLKGDQVEAILRIRKTSILDFGEYVCQADNQIGADYASLMLERGSGGLDIVAYLPYIGSAAAGVALVLIIILVVYCCRRTKPANQTLTYPEEIIALNNEKPIIRGGAEIFNNKNLNIEAGYAQLGPDLRETRGMAPRPLSNLPQNFAGYYGNRHLNNRLEDDRMSSRSSSHSTLPPDSYSRPPPNSAYDHRRSTSPYNSDAVDYSTSSTMSSVLSRGSKSSRSHPVESTLSSGEDSPLMLARGSRFPAPSHDPEDPRWARGNFSDSDDGGRGRRAVYHSDSEDGGRGRLSLPRASHSDSEDGGGGGKPRSGYYSEGERTRRMPRLSENKDEDDELRTLTE